MSELVTIEKTQVASVFVAGGLTPYIDQVREAVIHEVHDVNTKKGRDKIASLAYQVTRSKTYLEKVGKEYVTELKALPKVVDAERKRMRDILDELSETVRAPLTEWENKEKARVQTHEQNITAIHAYTGATFQTSADVANAILEVEGIALGESWEEFLPQATKAKDTVLMYLRGKKSLLEEEERQAEEEAKARAEAEEKERQEREAQIAKDAAEKAQREAEEKAAREKEEAEAAAKAEREEAERREAKLKAEAEQAQREKEEADKRAAKAAQEERERIESEQREKKKEEAKRRANEAYRNSLNNAVASQLVTCCGINIDQAFSIVDAIADGSIDNVSINY